MAVAPTGDIFKALSFDNVSSRSYGVYITGEAVYNAPEREVEMISIPGRNGDFALDKGRFENIEVTYPAGIFSDNETDFAEAISDFRNFLCSRKGYVRLTDEYNPDEYRMAIYKSGVEVEPALLRAGKFDITFDCKPQRYLTSGEAEQTSAGSNISVTNPTLFDACPLIKFSPSDSYDPDIGMGLIVRNDKYGTDGYYINITNEAIGAVDLLDSSLSVERLSFVKAYTSDFNTGDSVYIVLGSGGLQFRAMSNGTVEITSVSKQSGGTLGSSATYDGDTVTFNLVQTLVETVGTDNTKTDTYSVTVKRTPSVGSAVTTVYTIDVKAAYLSRGGYEQFSVNIAPTTNSAKDPLIKTIAVSTDTEVTSAIGYSTASKIRDPSYIDCELGEAYTYDSNGRRVSLNKYVELRSDLPVLTPGTNTVVKNGDIEASVIPRWWKV